MTLTFDLLKYIFLGVIYSRRLSYGWIFLSIPFLQKIFTFGFLRESFNYSFSCHGNSLFDLLLMGIGVKMGRGAPKLGVGVFLIPFFLIIFTCIILVLVFSVEVQDFGNFAKKRRFFVLGFLSGITLFWCFLSVCFEYLFTSGYSLESRRMALKVSYYLILGIILMNLGCVFLIYFQDLKKSFMRKRVKFDI